MRNSIIIIFLVAIFTAPYNCIAAEREWTTQDKLSNGDLITLHWVAVYEGRDTVYKISKNGKVLHLGELGSAGQPVTNLDNYLIAFPYCADDGCSPTVSIVDIRNLNVLPHIELDYNGQFYLNCKWVDGLFEIEIEHEPWGKTKGATTIHRYKVVNQNSSIIKQ